MVEFLKSISTPIIWVLVFLILGLVFTKKRRSKPGSKGGWYFAFSGTIILLFLSIPFVSNLLVYSLEFQYQQPSKETLSNLDIVVILAGGAFPPGGLREHAEASGATYSRVFNGVEAFKQSSARVIVLSGLGRKATVISEAEVMKRLAIRLGVAEDRIVIEAKSHNTMEQAHEVAALLASEKNQQIGIVTSAIHMLRAEKVFKKKCSADTIVAIPVNYTCQQPALELTSIIPTSGAFGKSTCAIHEWIGLLWYNLAY